MAEWGYISIKELLDDGAELDREWKLHVSRSERESDKKRMKRINRVCCLRRMELSNR
jgi:hypothetical protein